MSQNLTDQDSPIDWTDSFKLSKTISNHFFSSKKNFDAGFKHQFSSALFLIMQKKILMAQFQDNTWLRTKSKTVKFNRLEN